MNKPLLRECFTDHGYDLEYIPMHEAISCDTYKKNVVYTSVEDPGLYYKEFIEDIVLGLELNGARLLPAYQFLRATNDKVYMEILRHSVLPRKYWINTSYYGCLEELSASIKDIEYPCVVKTAEGAVSRGVAAANNQYELLKIVKKFTTLTGNKAKLVDFGRSLKHKGYQRESWHRKKFIVQEMLQDIQNDWKVLVYYDKFFVLRRENRPNDFRASGSGLFSFDEEVDIRLLEAAREIITLFNLPMISLDLAFKEEKVVLFEFQAVYFGTSTLEKSPYYYIKKSGYWQQIKQKTQIEEAYAYSISSYLTKGLPA